MQKEVNFNELAYSDLILDAVYLGGQNKNAGDDPISKLLKCGNQGGFRYAGSINALKIPYIVLYSSLDDPDWPDFLDFRTGVFTYFGDNKKPGHELHNTPKKGNLLLRQSFSLLDLGQRVSIPPYLIFTKKGVGRDVVFRGLAVPGVKGLQPIENLIAIWKTQKGNRFQNYKASFTILDCERISREWINDLESGNKITNNTPIVYKEWLTNGIYLPLMTEKSIEYRYKKDQIPNNKDELSIILEIHNFFKDPFSFEKCAAELIKLMDKNVVAIDLTRPWVDGGRDGFGKYRIGTKDNSIDVEFAFEAKRYGLNNSVGVEDTSRLISRIRFRQFGILVTTSYVHIQAYKEIIEDGHPIIIISACDIVYILKQAGISSLDQVKIWLKKFS